MLVKNCGDRNEAPASQVFDQLVQKLVFGSKFWECLIHEQKRVLAATPLTPTLICIEPLEVRTPATKMHVRIVKCRKDAEMPWRQVIQIPHEHGLQVFVYVGTKQATFHG